MVALIPFLLALPFGTGGASAPPPGQVLIVRNGNPLPVFPDLATALAAAQDADLLILSEGVFSGPGNRNQRVTKDIVIRGAGSEGSVIDCQGAGRALETIDADLTLRDVTIRGGLEDRGGAIRAKGGVLSLCGVVFEDNEVTSVGGAVDTDSNTVLLITDCGFRRNRAPTGSGGALAPCGPTTVEHSRFEENFSDAIGGAVGLTSSQPVHFTDCRFSANTGLYGGAIGGAFVVNLEVDRCRFIGNEAKDGGGAIQVGPLAFGVAFIFNSLVTGNRSERGGAGVSGMGIGLLNCTVVGNESKWTGPGGIAVTGLGSPTAVLNCIVRNNVSAATSLREQQVGGPGGGLKGVSILYSNVAGIAKSPTNFDAPPLFVDPAGGDYHLRPDSPCLDAGATLGLSFAQTDLDGKRRIQGAGVDTGAYEIPSRIEHGTRRRAPSSR